VPLPIRDERKRNQILDSAATLFSHRGYDKTSIRFLATEARVSTSTIYSHFTDKNDLLLHSIERRLVLIEEKVVNAAETGTDNLEALSCALSIIHKALKDDPFLCKIIIFDPHVVDHRLHERASATRERIQQFAINGLQAAVQDGSLECDDVEALEAILRLSFQGWLLSIENGIDEVSEERFTAMLIYLLKGRCK